MTPLQKLACSHPGVTPEDGEGYAICVRCFGVLVVALTRAMLSRNLAAVK